MQIQRFNSTIWSAGSGAEYDFHLVIDKFYQEHNHRITQWNNTLLNPPLLENYARAINLKEVHYSIALVL